VVADFICAICGESIPMERKQGYIIEVSDRNFYWFGGQQGFCNTAKFVHHLRKNAQKNYTKIHKILPDGTTMELLTKRYVALERYIENYAKYQVYARQIGFHQGSRELIPQTTIQPIV
jgi:hypothetical protein